MGSCKGCQSLIRSTGIGIICEISHNARHMETALFAIEDYSLLLTAHKSLTLGKGTIIIGMIYFQRGTDEVGDGVIRYKVLSINIHAHRLFYLAANPHIMSMLVSHNRQITRIMVLYISIRGVLFLLTIIQCQTWRRAKEDTTDGIEIRRHVVFPEQAYNISSINLTHLIHIPLGHIVILVFRCIIRCVRLRRSIVKELNGGGSFCTIRIAFGCSILHV